MNQCSISISRKNNCFAPCTKIRGALLSTSWFTNSIFGALHYLCFWEQSGLICVHVENLHFELAPCLEPRSHGRQPHLRSESFPPKKTTGCPVGPVQHVLYQNLPEVSENSMWFTMVYPCTTSLLPLEDARELRLHTFNLRRLNCWSFSCRTKHVGYGIWAWKWGWSIKPWAHHQDWGSIVKSCHPWIVQNTFTILLEDAKIVTIPSRND